MTQLHFTKWFLCCVSLMFFFIDDLVFITLKSFGNHLTKVPSSHASFIVHGIILGNNSSLRAFDYCDKVEFKTSLPGEVKVSN